MAFVVVYVMVYLVEISVSTTSSIIDLLSVMSIIHTAHGHQPAQKKSEGEDLIFEYILRATSGSQNTGTIVHRNNDCRA